MSLSWPEAMGREGVFERLLYMNPKAYTAPGGCVSGKFHSMEMLPVDRVSSYRFHGLKWQDFSPTRPIYVVFVTTEEFLWEPAGSTSGAYPYP
jgi:hypothetical protein